MSSEEKAKWLIEQFSSYNKTISKNDTIFKTLKGSKLCALITCNEVIKSIPYNKRNLRQYTGSYMSGDEQFIDYWEDVIRHIEKL